MSRNKPWLKMWTEWLGDAKMDRLSLAEQGSWWRLVSLCHECGHLDKNGKLDGALVVAGTPLSLAEITKSLKITEEIDKAVFNQMVERMKAAGSLHWNSDTLFVTHYEERQRALTDTKEDRARRQRDRREAKEQEKREAEKRTPPLPEEEAEAEAEAESHAQSCHGNTVTHAQPPKNSNGKPVTSPALAKIATLHEQYFGIITSVLSEKFKDFVDNYHGPVEWIDLAFAEAVQLKNRRWQYVEAILYNWQEKGEPHADRREQGGKSPATHREDAGEDSRFSGFRAIESGPDEPDDGEED